VGDLAALGPSAGLIGAVVALLGWYSKTSKETRQEYRDALAAAKTEFEARLKDEHARVLEADMHAQTEIEDLRRRLADADTVIMGERAARRDSELDKEGFKIRLEHAQLRIKILKGEDVDL
jgi:nucleotide-binding universal stress UspA family protein